MTKYKLTYFNVRFYAEPIKYIFAYANVAFEDNRITQDDWPQLKGQTPFGKLPVLEVDGKELSQSVAICRYLGKKFGLATRDPVKEAYLEAVIDNHKDALSAIMEAFHNPATKEDNEKITKNVYTKLDAQLSNGYFYGSEPTWVDIYIAGMIDTLENFYPGYFNPYPNLRSLCYKIKTKPALKKYLENRPPYPVFDPAQANSEKDEDTKNDEANKAA